MKRLLAGVLLFMCFYTVNAQTHFADYFSVGSSLTYLRFVEKDNDLLNYGYNEFTLNVNGGIRLTKNLFAGLQVLNIHTANISTSKKNQYWMYGVFSQYSLFDTGTAKFFVEASLNRGNYCTAGNIPYEVDNLNYLGIGGGLELSLNKARTLFLDLSFINYAILNEIEHKYAYTQYVCGLNYRFNAR